MNGQREVRHSGLIRTSRTRKVRKILETKAGDIASCRRKESVKNSEIVVTKKYKCKMSLINISQKIKKF
jgi:hypothetical protein